MPSIPVIIGNITFKTQTSAKEYIQKIIKEINITNSIKRKNDKHYPFLESLVKRHPYISKYENMTDLSITQNALNKNALQLNIIRNDGSIEDISWHVCLNPNKDRYNENFKSALRYSIKEQCSEYYINAILKCSNEYCISQDSDEFHVDHYIHFQKLIDEFMKGKNKDEIPSEFDEADDNSNRRQFQEKDSKFKNEWIEYHKKYSILRILCKDCNLKRNKYI